jgi:predicted ArsR family transcriptional regulator
MKTSRQRVLEYVQAHYPVTAADLSQALRMTEANARHHLSILQERGLLQPAGQRPARAKGRPAQLYMPSEQILGHNLDQLAAALLEWIISRLSAAELDDALRSLAGQIAWPGEPDLPVSGENLTRRLYRAVHRLNELHYQARWEAWRGAPRLILGHCPYAAILDRHPELCRLDAHILEGLAQAQVEQTGKLAPDTQGALHCIFRITETRKRSIKLQGF